MSLWVSWETCWNEDLDLLGLGGVRFRVFRRLPKMQLLLVKALILSSKTLHYLWKQASSRDLLCLMASVRPPPLPEESLLTFWGPRASLPGPQLVLEQESYLLHRAKTPFSGSTLCLLPHVGGRVCFMFTWMFSPLCLDVYSSALKTSSKWSVHPLHLNQSLNPGALIWTSQVHRKLTGSLKSIFPISESYTQLNQFK